MHIVYETGEIIRLFSDRMDEIVVFKEDLDSFDIDFKEECLEELDPLSVGCVTQGLIQVGYSGRNES